MKILKNISGILGIIAGILPFLYILIFSATPALMRYPVFNILPPIIMSIGVVGAILVLRNLVKTGSIIMILFGILITLVFLPLFFLSALLIIAGILGIISAFKEKPFEKRKILTTIIIIIIIIIVFIALFNIGYFVNKNKTGYSQCAATGGICKTECGEGFVLLRHFEGERLCPKDLDCCRLKVEE
jgi:hypothetical protein